MSGNTCTVLISNLTECVRVFAEPQRLPVQESISKRVQLPEGLLGVDHQSVPGDDSFGVAVHHRDERIRGGLWANAHSGKILLQQVAASEIEGLGVKTKRDEGFLQTTQQFVKLNQPYMNRFSIKWN